MSLLDALDSTILTAVYASPLAIAMSYNSRTAAPASIQVIPSTDAQLFPGGFEAQTSQAISRVRVRKSEVVTPRRGEQLTDADGIDYVIDHVDDVDTSPGEWLLTLRVCDV